MIKGEYKGDCGAASYGDAIAAYGWQRRLSQAQYHVYVILGSNICPSKRGIPNIRKTMLMSFVAG